MININMKGIVAAEPSIQAKSYGEECDVRKNECDPSKYQECLRPINGTGGNNTTYCLCSGETEDPPRTLYFNTLCFILAGESCTPGDAGQRCMYQSECSTIPEVSSSELHQEKAASQCVCVKNNVLTSERRCQPTYGGRCRQWYTLDCIEGHFFDCPNVGSESVCECIDSYKSWYNPQTTMCALNAGEYCETNATSMPCTELSFCKDNICSCLPGYDPSEDGKRCLDPNQPPPSYGSPCKMDSDCGEDLFLVCGADETCECGFNSWYDGEDCVLLVGESCSSGQKCTNSSVCDPNYDRCSCGSNAEATSDKKSCVKHFGSACSSQGDCNAEEFLTCDPDALTCACEENSWYTNGECVLLVGEDCSSSGQPCTDNLPCHSTENKCLCGASSGASSDKHGCVGGYGAYCNYDEECSPDMYLSCQDQYCMCNYDSWYNERTKQCELLAGSYCSSSNASQPCTEFSNCQNQTCKCADGYRNYNGKCGLSFGSPCSSFDDCTREAFLVCGPSETCVCGWYNSWFNPRSGKCELLVGEACVPQNDEAEGCTEYSNCVQNDDNKPGHKCKCEDRFLVSDKHRCVHESCECSSSNLKLDSFLLSHMVNEN